MKASSALAFALMLIAVQILEASGPPWNGQLDSRPSAYFWTPSDSELDLEGKDVTIEVWVRLDVNAPIVDADSWSAAGCGWIVNKSEYYRFGIGSGREQSGLVRGYICTGPGLATIHPNTDMTVWHHVAWEVDTQGQGRWLERGFFDGYAVAGGYGPYVPLPNTPSPMFVGQNLWGQIEELRISSILRYPINSPTYSVPSDPFVCDEHTRALWHFDETDRIFHDQCGHDNLLRPVRLSYLPIIYR
jgi:hypothetical protein